MCAAIVSGRVGVPPAVFRVPRNTTSICARGMSLGVRMSRKMRDPAGEDAHPTRNIRVVLRSKQMTGLFPALVQLVLAAAAPLGDAIEQQEKVWKGLDEAVIVVASKRGQMQIDT